MPSGTDIRRMLAKAQETRETETRAFKAALLPAEADCLLRYEYARGVEAALTWVLGERKEPPIA